MNTTQTTKAAKKSNAIFQCQECGKLFATVKAAEKASNCGCPKCGGSDIDLAR